MKRVLVLGGTGDAARLVAEAVGLPDLEIISSLAGRVRQPTRPAGQVRIGGFGGTEGLVQYLCEQRIDLLIDATHPFAAQMSQHAAAAALTCGIPLLMLVRPAWEPMAGDHWLSVPSISAAVEVLPGVARRVFLTIGRQELAPFASLRDLWFLMRMIDPPQPDTLVPPGTLLLARGPFALEDERLLLQTHAIQTIVSKNSGGDATYAKIQAARELGLPVVMIERAPLPEGEKVADVGQAMAWLRRHV
jgi:precorrin-6A/cobalt-precorrin-6A reductase